ncbi:hypothetical protein EYC98_04610 [Halieaceae bacterium IMCC14734]|uniref:DUF5916 domain-containing protein n=1 Tax=Candidatus Litorirhabdus singularis TaxID=2518993 RepID=A0ABT3TED1_9GAMM|nr:DUF5916 domain-containing protein [Candidatus Litorirhabdus singularis]MCX2980146.1 hypothetical protein [Candidatus Litorirhabdus singularis]
MDGVLDEPEWQSAQSYSNFVTTEPLTSEPAKYHTEALVYTNAEGIYVGFRNAQPAEAKRVQRRFARDAFILADRNIVGIDFDGSGLSGYDFTVGAANTRQDGIYNNEKNYSGDWDGNWTSQTSQDEEYWYVEMYIPWTVAPMTNPEGAQKQMKFYFGRYVFDESLRFAWPNASAARPTFLSDWAPVSVDHVATSTLDLFPYVSAEQDLEENDGEVRAGVDVVWRPNTATQFTGTINPDFGQVEADDLVLNFSALEVFFAERRPFFTENQALFRSEVPNGDRLVHTRRIGAASDAGDEPVTDIDLGAKLSHFGERLDLGFFAVTEDDTAASEGRDYLSTRIQARLGDAVVGHSLTYADRSTLSRKALVNSLDLDWQSAGEHRVRGQLFYSDVEQEANEVNENTAFNQSDGGGWGQWSYAPNDEWRSNLTGYYYGDEFEMNDLGFLTRNDWMRVAADVRHDVNSYAPSSNQLSGWYSAKLSYEENNAGDTLMQGLDLQRQWVLRSTREFSLQVHLETSAYDDLITRGNGLLKRDAQQSFSFSYLNPRGNDFTFQLQYVAETKGTDKFSHEFIISPQYYLADTVTVGGRVSYTWFEEWLLWDFDSEQLATYESEVLDIDLRLDWFPTSRQEVRVKLQWLGVESDALQGYGLDDNGRLDPSSRPVADFKLSDVALQVRYRYEIAPLSEVFLVYNRGGFWDENDAGVSPWGLAENAWNNVTQQTITAKIRYRF